jgi:hypothetical protein
MYASIFSYRPSRERYQLIGYKLPDDKIVLQQNLGTIPTDSLILLQGFMAANETDQREKYLEKKQKIEELLRVLFKILDNIKTDGDLILYILALINGILEDKRTRVRNIVAMEKSANEAKKVEAVRILFDFLIQNKHEGQDAINQRDLASHTLAQIIVSLEYANCDTHARHFLTYLMERKNHVSDDCKSACILMLMKSNELA